MGMRLIDDAHQLSPSMVRVARQHVESVARAHGISTEEVLDQSDKWEKQHEEGPPQLKDDAVRKQFVPQMLVDTVDSMTWRVISAPKSESFLTGDNPLFTPEGSRTGRPHGEFSIPLSSRVALHGSWQEAKNKLCFVNGSPSLVKEINRRSVANAQRFVFYHLRASWVEKLMRSQVLELHSMQWTSKSSAKLLPPPPFNPPVWTDESLLEDLKSPPVDLVNYLTGIPS